MKCQINCFLAWCLSLDDFLLTCCLAMEPIRGVITFQSALTRVNLRMGYVYAWLLLKSLPAHLWNVLKYDYLIVKTKEAISLISLWKLSLHSNSLCYKGRKKKQSERRFSATANHRMSIRKGHVTLKWLKVLGICWAQRTNRNFRHLWALKNSFWSTPGLSFKNPLNDRHSVIWKKQIVKLRMVCVSWDS